MINRSKVACMCANVGACIIAALITIVGILLVTGVITCHWVLNIFRWLKGDPVATLNIKTIWTELKIATPRQIVVGSYFGWYQCFNKIFTRNRAE